MWLWLPAGCESGAEEGGGALRYVGPVLGGHAPNCGRSAGVAAPALRAGLLSAWLLTGALDGRSFTEHAHDTAAGNDEVRRLRGTPALVFPVAAAVAFSEQAARIAVRAGGFVGAVVAVAHRASPRLGKPAEFFP
jgi:hypothetical protein